MSYGDSEYGDLPYALDVALALVSVDGDNTTLDAQVGIAVVIADNILDATAFKLLTTTGGFSATGLNLSGTAQAYTVDIPDVSAYSVDTLGIPFSSANWSIEYEVTVDATQITLGGTHNPKAGWATVDVLSGSIAEGSIFADRPGGAPADTSQIYYDTADNTTVSPSGIFATDASTVSGQLFNVTSGEWEAWSVTIATGGGGARRLTTSYFTQKIHRAGR